MRFNKYFIMFILILIGSSILGYASKNSKDISIEVAGVNAETVGLYEKFEIEVYIQGASYTNPYDPAQIDIRAVITSPSDSVWNIFGFYDDFQDIDKWKVRFSANETGEWSYYLTAVNGTDSAQSTSHVFTVTESDHHGWLMISPNNPYYFIHDDGTSFFGVGAYYPWGVDNSTSGLGRLEEHGANMFGYWNIMYGGEGNIIESLDSGLGRYDQSKCGRIDMILGWAEERNMIMMFAFWPHDLLSNTVWAHQWHNNPYKDICDVEDFFADETAWFYQERQYRYLIARWGYSRSLGIWEIVNEINGTDGWEAGNQTEATNWVANVHQFFKENDPFKSPTTASMSGGHYWSEGYAEVDIPNVHLYESGWPQQYPGNPLRSSLWTYYNVTGQFRNDFQKPAILGEAGYTDTYGNFNVPSDEYTKLYHNALWVTWAGGLSMTPVWWDYGSVNIMSDEVMDQMLSFSMIVNKVDYAGYSSEHVNVVGMDCDGFAMKNSQTGWGWVREVNDNSIQGKSVSIEVNMDSSYVIDWYNTWTGEKIASNFRTAENGIFTDVVPALENDTPDAAFFFALAETGEIPYKLQMVPSDDELFIGSADTALITCYVTDSLGRIVTDAQNEITFFVEGPGTFSGLNPVVPQNGKVEIDFYPENEVGTAEIIVSSPDLMNDSIQINILNKVIIDDFEDYLTNVELQNYWKTRTGTMAAALINDDYVGSGEKSMQMNYIIGEGNPPYAGVFKNLTGFPSGMEKLKFWFRPDNSNRMFAILLKDENNETWQYYYPILGADSITLEVPFSEFIPVSGSDEINPEIINEISLNVLQGSGETGQGTIFFDDIIMEISIGSNDIPGEENLFLPKMYSLNQNYPNPFNPETNISYSLPIAGEVKIVVYNIAGQLIDTLINKKNNAGFHFITWNAAKYSSGVYFIHMMTENFSSVKKCILIK